MSERLQRSPDFRDNFAQWGDNVSAAIRACAPGTVLKIWPGDMVDIQLSVKELDADDNPESLPTLRKVPLFNFGNPRIFTRYPVLIGDPVFCMFGDVDLDSWKGVRGQSTVDAGSDRRHDLSDCVAMPIGWGQFPPGLELLGFISTMLTNLNAAMVLSAPTDPVLSNVVQTIVNACNALPAVDPGKSFATALQVALTPLIVTPDTTAVSLVATLTPLIARLTATGVKPS